MLVDSHCHLDSFDPAEQPDLIRRAREAGVAELVTIGTGMEQSRSLRDLAARLGVWCTVGVHPNSVADAPLATAADSERPVARSSKPHRVRPWTTK